MFGFEELAGSVSDNITIDDDQLSSAANGRTFTCGSLSTPTLTELRDKAADVASTVAGTPLVREVVGDAGALHANPAHAGALFQVASQFNLLEMPDPEVTPADGITGYVYDHTQGPACAMACAAGTLQRNWFAQSSDAQIDTLAAVGEALGNLDASVPAFRWWSMLNGYALLTGDVPADVPESHPELAIGLHTDTEVTLAGEGHLVTQAYCSALPVAYSDVDPDIIEPLARMVLNSAYEATLAAATINAARPGGSNSVFLTLLGGGVFGNPVEWIVDAIERAVDLYAHVALDIAIVSHGAPNPAIAELLT